MITNAQYNKAVAIVPDDAVNFVNQGTADNCCSAIYVGSAGDVVVVFQDGSTCTFTCPMAGQVLPVKAKRVNATNTTASGLVALYQV